MSRENKVRRTRCGLSAALAAVQRKMNADVLVVGHRGAFASHRVEDRLILFPGSATGTASFRERKGFFGARDAETETGADGVADAEEADSSIAARVFDAAYHNMGNNFGALYSRLLKPRGWTYATTANRTGGLYTAPGARGLSEKIAGTHTFESADEVLKFVREDPSMAKELRRLAGDDSSGGGSVFKPSTISLWRSSTTPQTGTKGFVSTFFTTKAKEKRGGKRKGYDGHGRRPGKRSRRLDARDARLRGEEERRKADAAKHEEEVTKSKKINEQLKTNLEAMLSAPQRS